MGLETQHSQLSHWLRGNCCSVDYTVGPHGKLGDTGVFLGISDDDMGCHPRRWFSLWRKFSTSFFAGRIISTRSTEFWVEVIISDGYSSSSFIFIREVCANLHPSVPRPQDTCGLKFKLYPNGHVHHQGCTHLVQCQAPSHHPHGDTGTSISEPAPPRALLLGLNIPPHLSFSSASSCSLSWSLWLSAHSSQCWPSPGVHFYPFPPSPVHLLCRLLLSPWLVLS